MRFATSSPVSVSYTHLDVYKRQLPAFVVQAHPGDPLLILVAVNQDRRACDPVLERVAPHPGPVRDTRCV